MMNLKRIALTVFLLFSFISVSAQQQDTIPTPPLVQKPDSLVVDSMGVIDYSYEKKYLLKDIVIKGIQSINSGLLINSIGLVKGDSVKIPSDYISQALKKLWAYRGVSDIKANMIVDGDDIVLELVLKERPYVSQWPIIGVTSAQAKELYETLKLSPNQQFSEYTAAASAKAIEDFFKKKGYFNTIVQTEYQNDTLKFGGRNYMKVVFRVHKGEKVKIKEIVFTGNDKELPAKKLKGAMKKTKEKKLVNMFKGAKFKEKDYKDDKENLVEYMHSKGYRNAAVLSDSIYPIGSNRLGIKIDILQGDKYHYRNITFTGNEKHSNETLSAILGIKKGDLYDSKTMNNRLGVRGSEAIAKGIMNISSLYQDDGHLNFMMEPVETEIKGDSIDVDVRIMEGKQFRINDITIAGNTRTHDRTIRRELFVHPGELYSQQLLISSMTKLQGMGNFTAESAFNPSLNPVNGSEDLVDIGFNLEETSTDQFSLSGGFGAGTFVVSIGVTFNNVSLKKIFRKNAWRPYPAGDNQKFRLQVQSNGTYYKAISFSFLEPWLGGNKPNSLGISMYYSSQTNGYTIFDKGDAQFNTMGVSVDFGTRLNWPDPFFQFTVGLNYQHYKLNNWSNFIMRNGISHIISLGMSLTRNSVNSPIYPTAGSEFLIKLTATPPYSLFKPKDYYANKNLTDQERYRFIEFFKIDLKARIYQGLIASDKLVFHAGAQFGYLGHYNPNLISPFEGFSVGGSGVSGYNLYGITYVGLRGYPDGSLTPRADYGEQGRIYSKYTMELRYPFVMKGSTTMFGLIFAEAGNAGYGWRGFNPFDLKKSIGAGVRVMLPMVGMFGIDFGYGFDPVPGKTTPAGFNFHFSMGQQF